MIEGHVCGRHCTTCCRPYATGQATNAIEIIKKREIEMGYEINGCGVHPVGRNTGMGMTKEEIGRVVGQSKEFRVEQQTGAGNWIAKSVADAYYGQIGLASVSAGGGLFRAILCANMQGNEPNGSGGCSGNRSEGGSPDGERSRDCSTLKILVAEDSDSNYMLLKVLLKGYALTRALNGQEAVDLARDGDFDLILMDIRMPIMNGIEATQQIRQFNATIPIIAVTANAFPEDRQCAFDAGVSDFLTKPISKATLMEAILRA